MPSVEYESYLFKYIFCDYEFVTFVLYIKAFNIYKDTNFYFTKIKIIT